MIKHLFRYICLVGVFVIPTFFMLELDNFSKFPVLIGGVAGITLAYLAGIAILHYRKKRQQHKKG